METKINYPPGYPQKALQIQELFDAHIFNNQHLPPEGWGQAVHSATKLMVVMINPVKYDPDGTKQDKYLSVINNFNIENLR